MTHARFTFDGGWERRRRPSRRARSGREAPRWVLAPACTPRARFAPLPDESACPRAGRPFVSVPSSSRSPARRPLPARRCRRPPAPSPRWNSTPPTRSSGTWTVPSRTPPSSGFTSTNAVLTEANLPAITLAQYMVGTRYATPQRLAWHATGDVDHPSGVAPRRRLRPTLHRPRLPPDRRFLPRRRGPRRRARRRPEQVPGGAVQRLRRVRQGGDGRQRRRQTHDARARRGRRAESQTRPGRSVGAVRGDGMATRAVCVRGRLPVRRRRGPSRGDDDPSACAWGAHDRVACEGSFDALVETVDELAALLLGGSEVTGRDRIGAGARRE